MRPSDNDRLPASSHLAVRQSRASQVDSNRLLACAIDWCSSRGLPVPSLWVIKDAHWNQSFADCIKTATRSDKPVAHQPQLSAGDVIVIDEMEHLFSACYDAADCIHYLRKQGLGLYVMNLGVDLAAAETRVSADALLKAMANIERQRSQQRVQQVKQRQRSKGRYLGGSRPFGYTVHENGRLIENPMEQRILKRIHRLHGEGRSLRAIANEVSTPLTPISFKTVQRVLKRHV